MSNDCPTKDVLYTKKKVQCLYITGDVIFIKHFYLNYLGDDEIKQP